MADKVTGTPGTGSENPFEVTVAIGKPVLVETGTSSKWRVPTAESYVLKLKLRPIIQRLPLRRSSNVGLASPS